MMGLADFHQYHPSRDAIQEADVILMVGCKLDNQMNFGNPPFINKDTKLVTIQGVGLTGLQAPDSPLDVGNSGTGIRLITGILAMQQFESSISGDHSIQKRPMTVSYTHLTLPTSDLV